MRRWNLLLTIFATVASVATVIPAFGHSVFVPPSHLGLAAHSSHLVGLPSAHGHSAFVLPGIGSTSLKVNGLLLKNTVAAGFANGQNLAINQAVSGAISSGIITGQFYSFTGAGYTRVGPHYTLAFGSNSFNSPTGHGASGTSITFSSGGGGFKHGSGTGGGGVGSDNIFAGNSGSARAFNSLFRTAAGSATLAGEKSITALGPVTGGQFNAALGESTGSVIINYGNYFFAFGNSPYFVSNPATIPGGMQPDHLLFGNTSRQIIGGQLFGTLYQTGSINFGNYGLAFGNSPFNKLGTFSLANYKNVINLAPLLVGHKF